MSQSIPVVVIGSKGRLGALIVAAAHAATDIDVVGELTKDASLATTLAVLCSQKATPKVVVIDATTAGSTQQTAALCAQYRCPYVVATTGLSTSDRQSLADAARDTAVLHAANLSVSAHAAALVVSQLSSMLREFDIEIVEAHHNKKKDAPSGTALMLAQAASEKRQESSIVTGRNGLSPRTATEIGISAVRGGDVVGEHTVMFLGTGERIDLAHKITDRSVFARGALDAARFLFNKPAGTYEMAAVALAKRG